MGVWVRHVSLKRMDELLLSDIENMRLLRLFVSAVCQYVEMV